MGKKTKIIGTNAFSGCTSLTNIELPETVEQIQDGAFSECSRLKRIVLPKNLKEIDIYALEHCPALEIIINDSKIPCYMPWYKKIRHMASRWEENEDNSSRKDREHRQEKKTFDTV